MPRDSPQSVRLIRWQSSATGTYVCGPLVAGSTVKFCGGVPAEMRNLFIVSGVASLKAQG